MKKLIAIAAILTSAYAANAQNASSAATQTVNLNLANAIEITFTGSGTATGASVNLAFNTVNDYANGVSSAAQSLNVRSNKAFGVTVKASAANFSYAGTTTPSPVMPVSGVLGVQVTANGTGGTTAGTFASASTGLTSVAQNMINNATPGGSNPISVVYKATPGFNYPAGTYTVDVVYTATQL